MSEKRKNGFEKMPWGIFAGISAMLCSLITIGLIVVFTVSKMMIEAVDSDDGLSQSWWLILLYIGEAGTIAIFIVACVFGAISGKRKKAARIEEMQMRLEASRANGENDAGRDVRVSEAVCDNDAEIVEKKEEKEKKPTEESSSSIEQGEIATTSEQELSSEQESSFEQETDAPSNKKPRKPRAKKYHISQRDDGRWQVKREGSDKVLKLFDTQKQAIDYAKTVADNQSGSIVIHKVDGKIRKQNY